MVNNLKLILNHLRHATSQVLYDKAVETLLLLKPHDNPWSVLTSPEKEKKVYGL